MAEPSSSKLEFLINNIEPGSSSPLSVKDLHLQVVKSPYFMVVRLMFLMMSTQTRCYNGVSRVKWRIMIDKFFK